MATFERAFFLVPEAHWQSEKIKLGSILRDPKRPDEIFDDGITIPEADTYETTKNCVVKATADFKKNRFNLFAQFLQLFLGVGADLGVSHEKVEILRFEARQVTTKYFEPSLDYMEQLLHIPLVRILCRRNIRKRLNLFIVTAIMVVEGLSIKTVSSEGYGVEGSIGVDGTMTGLPVGVGSGIGIKCGDVCKVSANAAGPLVFAYQVREIKRKSWGKAGQVKAVGYTKGAQLDSGAEPGAGPRVRDPTDDFELSEYDGENGYGAEL
ncbi:hypothetical protein ABW21_db0203624 [Orbilia brochopaga]|nr:hypothetical protein ABW21_db0203624 [Drechslerella brochopaga]